MKSANDSDTGSLSTSAEREDPHVSIEDKIGSPAPPCLIPVGTDIITPEMLPMVRLEQHHIDAIVNTVPGFAANIQDIYPLSPAQEGVLFHSFLDTQRDPYLLSTLFELDSRAQVTRLIDSVQRLVDRHDILRSAVHWEQLPCPVQVVYRRAKLSVEELSVDPNRDVLDEISTRIARSLRMIDLRRAPLVRMEFVGGHDGRWYASLQFHHLACDDVTWRAALEEVMRWYEGCERELREPLAYRDYVSEALSYSKSRDAEVFFQAKLGEIVEPTAPFGILDVHGDGLCAQEAHQVVENNLARRIRAQAQRMEVSPARLFHAAWALVVAHTSGRNDIVYGTVLLSARRGHRGEQLMLGISINTLPLRLQLKGLSAEELVRHTHSELIALLYYRNVSLISAQKCSGMTGSAPLFTALLNYRHREPNSKFPPADSALPRIILQRGARTNYPIAISVDDLGKDFALIAHTDPRIDPKRVTQYLHTAMQSLVEALEQSSQTSMLSWPIMPVEEWRRVIHLFNGPNLAFTQDKLIHQLYEEHARSKPAAVAVQYGGQAFTYAELNERANKLARYLRGKGIGSDHLVAICVERSLEMVVGLLGILKAGGAYVPLDPKYPAERLCHMLLDAAPRVLLTHKTVCPEVSARATEVIRLDSDWDEIAKQPSHDLDSAKLNLHSAQLAYVIYTSGSTGKPKGVMIEHRHVTRLFAATAQLFDFNDHDVWTLFHSFAFDFSVWELWGALLHGGRVVIVPYSTTRSPQECYRLICAEAVTVLNQTPSAFAQLIDAQKHSGESQHSLRVVIFGGEALELRTLRPWVERNGADTPQLVNMYGITETTVHVTYRPPLAREEIESERSSPIGRPIADLRAYLLNDHSQPVPIAVAGEMYIAGAGVARGYLGRPELTAERFLPDPFSEDQPQARMYKTGDLGLWRSDGTLEYLGRNDHQVKIRGFRIELGEIEARLAQYPEVKDAIVVAAEGISGEKRLVAYVIAKDTCAAEDNLRAESLRTHVRAALPEYMVPSAFVFLKNWPLTPNGKLDRRALPQPDLTAYVSQHYEPPSGEIEHAVAAVWQEVLHLDRVGREDNFFELGGHSLLAMQVTARLYSSLAVLTPVRLLFDFPILRELSSQVEELCRNNLRDAIAETESDKLIEAVMSMPEDEVQKLLQQISEERHP